MMMQNPNGSRRPDFITLDGEYNQPFSVELKTGRGHKGILVSYQLHYAVSSEKDYEIFSEPGEDRLFPKMEPKSKGRIAYYYDIPDRRDKVTTEELDRPFSSIKLKWGDHYFLPPEVGLRAFIVARMMRTKEEFAEVYEELKKTISKDIKFPPNNYDASKTPQSWQNIHGRDIAAIFHEDLSLATKDGRARIDLLREHYPEIESLEKVTIQGPNGTYIYCLAEPEDKDLLSNQVRETINKRAPIIEGITLERICAEELLKKIKKVSNSGLFSLDVEASSYLLSELTEEEIQKLKRLSNWLAQGETPLSILPQKPDDDIPF
jgi:hypothetical protein